MVSTSSTWRPTSRHSSTSKLGARSTVLMRALTTDLAAEAAEGELLRLRGEFRATSWKIPLVLREKPALMLALPSYGDKTAEIRLGAS
jgi:hypothetical protein